MFLGFIVDIESQELQESIRDQWSLRMKGNTKRELTEQNTLLAHLGPLLCHPGALGLWIPASSRSPDHRVQRGGRGPPPRSNARANMADRLPQTSPLGRNDEQDKPVSEI